MQAKHWSKIAAAGAIANLYAVLSDEQKKEADYIVLPMVGMAMGIGVRGPRRTD